MSLCKYKDLLGKPNEGIHSYRFFGVAIADTIMTLIAIILISYYFKTPFIYTFIAVFALGIILHRLFCVRSTVDKTLFPNVKE